MDTPSDERAAPRRAAASGSAAADGFASQLRPVTDPGQISDLVADARLPARSPASDPVRPRSRHAGRRGHIRQGQRRDSTRVEDVWNGSPRDSCRCAGDPCPRAPGDFRIDPANWRNIAGMSPVPLLRHVQVTRKLSLCVRGPIRLTWVRCHDRTTTDGTSVHQCGDNLSYLPIQSCSISSCQRRASPIDKEQSET
jgi:hypothetical protein